VSGNSFGKLFSVTTFGESHGLALGCVIDGCPPGMELSEADIQIDLDRRRPGRNRHTTQRNEPDQVKILSGVFEGKTTGTPIGLIVGGTAHLLGETGSETLEGTAKRTAEEIAEELRDAFEKHAWI